MCKRNLFIFLLLAGLLLSACQTSQPQFATVEVTRLVRETQIAPVEVTRIVQEPKIVIVEVTRLIRETVIVTQTPLTDLTLKITHGVPLQVPRSHHTATRLLDGRILLVGGSQGPDEYLAKVEIFDPVSGLITQVAPLHTPRHDHSATLLPDGRVLVIGGYSLPRQWLDDAEVYDLTTDTWAIIPPKYSHGVTHTATLMRDGRILVVGGCITGGYGSATNRVEIFNPQTNTWSEAKQLEGNRANHTAELLDDGRVLVIGGGGDAGAPAGGDALLYNPQTNIWKATGPMIKPRIWAQSVKLSDGRVLVTGGMTLQDIPVSKISASAEIYDPVSNLWTIAADLSEARYAYNLALLPNGQVLVIGGVGVWESNWTEGSFVREIEVYDPITDRWHIAGELPLPEAFAAISILPDGRLWVTGGKAGQTNALFWLDTWLITLIPTQP